MILFWRLVCRNRSASPPGGNQVDGLPSALRLPHFPTAAGFSNLPKGTSSRGSCPSDRIFRFFWAAVHFAEQIFGHRVPVITLFVLVGEILFCAFLHSQSKHKTTIDILFAISVSIALCQLVFHRGTYFRNIFTYQPPDHNGAPAT